MDFIAKAKKFLRLDSKGQGMLSALMMAATTFAIVGVIAIMVFSTIYAGICKVNISDSAESLLTITDVVLAAVVIVGIVSVLALLTTAGRR